MDIKAKIEEIFEKIKGDKGFGEQFKQDPVKAVESVIGVNLPDEQMHAIVEGVKGKVKLENLEEMAEGAIEKVKDFLHLGHKEEK